MANKLYIQSKNQYKKPVFSREAQARFSELLQEITRDPQSYENKLTSKILTTAPQGKKSELTATARLSSRIFVLKMINSVSDINTITPDLPDPWVFMPLANPNDPKLIGLVPDEKERYKIATVAQSAAVSIEHDLMATRNQLRNEVANDEILNALYPLKEYDYELTEKPDKERVVHEADLKEVQKSYDAMQQKGLLEQQNPETTYKQSAESAQSLLNSLPSVESTGEAIKTAVSTFKAAPTAAVVGGVAGYKAGSVIGTYIATNGIPQLTAGTASAYLTAVAGQSLTPPATLLYYRQLGNYFRVAISQIEAIPGKSYLGISAKLGERLYQANIGFATLGDDVVFGAVMREQGVGILAKTMTGAGGKKVIQVGMQSAAGKTVTTLSSQAATKTAGLLAKLGVQVGAGAATAGIGLLIGFVIDLIIAGVKAIVKGINKLFTAITGEESAFKQMLALSGAALVMGLGLGSPILMFGGIAGMTGAGLRLVSGQGISKGLRGFGQSIWSGAIGAFLGLLAQAAFMSILFIAFLVALILFIINSGSFVTPPSPFGSSSTNPNQQESIYLAVEKVAFSASHPEKGEGPLLSFDNSDLPLTVTYTITIIPKLMSLTNINITYTCSVRKQGSTPNCPPDPTLPTPPASLGPSDPAYKITYTMTYSGQYTDSMILDTITVTADANGTPTQAVGSAAIRIGKPPEDCPSGWPVTVHAGIFQGPRGAFSHANAEAIDIGVNVGTSIYSTTTGVAVIHQGGVYGPNYVVVTSSCNGHNITVWYAHLSSVSISEGTVTMGTRIGGSGTEGTGPHLHYEFRGIPMAPPYIPRSVPYGCEDPSTCGYVN